MHNVYWPRNYCMYHRSKYKGFNCNVPFIFCENDLQRWPSICDKFAFYKIYFFTATKDSDEATNIPLPPWKKRTQIKLGFEYWIFYIEVCSLRARWIYGPGHGYNLAWTSLKTNTFTNFRESNLSNWIKHQYCLTRKLYYKNYSESEKIIPLQHLTIYHANMHYNNNLLIPQIVSQIYHANMHYYNNLLIPQIVSQNCSLKSLYYINKLYINSQSMLILKRHP